MMKRIICVLSWIAFISSPLAIAQGDKLEDLCYQSMRYNVYVQLAANSLSGQIRSHYEGEAFDSGKWQGISHKETERMIRMAENNESSMQFAIRYQGDDSFANAYRSGYINDCKQNPHKYISH
ncbi:hypothetical protein [Hafnia paralvei]|uniref:hypothetical protein n=1 Tax=Hafnia paralvei TaxID=546367 RepID=UPI0038D0A6C2